MSNRSLLAFLFGAAAGAAATWFLTSERTEDLRNQLKEKAESELKPVKEKVRKGIQPAKEKIISGLDKAEEILEKL